MIVCVCLGVSDSTLRTLALAGADSAEALARACGAGTDCGSCLGLLGAFVNDAPWTAGPGRAESVGATVRAR